MRNSKKTLSLVLLLGFLALVPVQAAGAATVTPIRYYSSYYTYNRVPAGYWSSNYQYVITQPRPAQQTLTQPQPAQQTLTQPQLAPASQVGQYDRQVLDLVNVRRAEAGLQPLAWDDRVAGLARIKSEDMRDHNYFGHQSPTLGSAFDMMQRAGITYHYAAENIAAGQRTPAAVVDAWMNSPGHKANILNAHFTRLGVGFASGGSYGAYWTQMFIGD